VLKVLRFKCDIFFGCFFPLWEREKEGGGGGGGGGGGREGRREGRKERERERFFFLY